MASLCINPWDRREEDPAMFERLKAEMMEDYRNAVKLLQHDDREAAQYLYGHGDLCKALLEEMFEFNPEQEIDELDGLLAILEEEL